MQQKIVSFKDDQAFWGENGVQNRNRGNFPIDSKKALHRVLDKMKFFFTLYPGAVSQLISFEIVEN